MFPSKDGLGMFCLMTQLGEEGQQLMNEKGPVVPRPCREHTKGRKADTWRNRDRSSYNTHLSGMQPDSKFPKMPGQVTILKCELLCAHYLKKPPYKKLRYLKNKTKEKKNHSVWSTRKKTRSFLHKYVVDVIQVKRAPRRPGAATFQDLQ